MTYLGNSGDLLTLVSCLIDKQLVILLLFSICRCLRSTHCIYFSHYILFISFLVSALFKYERKNLVRFFPSFFSTLLYSLPVDHFFCFFFLNCFCLFVFCFVLLFTLNYVHVYIWGWGYVCLYRNLGRLEALDPLEFKLQVIVSSLIWILGIDFRSSGRSAFIINHWAIFSNSPQPLCWLWSQCLR